MDKHLIGVDIGGTKISVGWIAADGQLLSETTLPSKADSREDLFQQTTTMIQSLMTSNALEPADCSIGVGVPGIVDAENGIAIFQNNLDWQNFPLKERLHQAFPAVATIKIDNDVVQAAFAEWSALDLAATDTMAFLTVSTGIASPVLYGGKAIRGLGAAGEIGLLPIRADFGTRLGRFEDVCSGPAIARAGQAAYDDSSLSTADVFQRYYAGEPAATKVIEAFVDSLTHGIYALTTIIDPQKIVLGGSVIKRNPQLLPLLQAALAKEIIPVQSKSIAALVLSTYDNNAGLIGAGLSAGE